MQAWQATVQDEQGNIIVNPILTVYQDDGVTLASIYDEAGAAKANPFIGTLEGFVQFWAQSGEYEIVGASGANVTNRWHVSIADPIEPLYTKRSVTELISDTRADYSVGDVFLTRAEGFSYEVVASGAHLTTAGGIGLRVLPGQGRIFDIRAFGARPVAGFDNAPAISAAITAAGLVDNGAVIIPAGEWETQTAIDVAMGSCRSLTIMGTGAKASIIKGRRGTYHGLLKVTRTLKDQLLSVLGLGLLCDNLRNDVSERPHGLYYTSTIGLNPDKSPMADYGYGHRRNFIGRDLFVGGYDRLTPFRGRLQNGVIIEFGRWPLLDNPTVDTSSPYDTLEDYPTTYVNGCGILFKDCYYGAALEPRVSGKWRHGIRFEGNAYRPPPSIHQDFEGAIVSGGEIVGWPEIGISINHNGRPEDDPTMSLKEPGFFISRTHVHGHMVGIRAYHHAVISILDCNIATTDANTTSRRENECHIDLHDVHSAIIDHCHFWGSGYDNGDTDCTRGIVVNDKVNHVSINGCHFMHRGIGVLVGAGDTVNLQVGDTNVWGGRAVSLVDVYQTIQPRIRVQKRLDTAQVAIPRMHDQSLYDGQVSAKIFDRGPGYWSQSVGWAEIVTSVSGGMPAGYTHALLLKSSGFEGRWTPDQLPQGATFKVTARFRNAENPYPVSLGVQVRTAAGVITSKVKNVSVAGAAGWQTASVIVSADVAECGGGWRPLIQMDGIAAGASDAVCQVVYFDVEIVRRQQEAFLPYSGLPLAISNGEMTFERVSNTQIRIWLRGMDGTLRSSLLTLS